MFLADKIYIEASTVDDIYQDMIKMCIYSNPIYYTRKRNGYSSIKEARTLYNYTWKVIDGVKYLVMPRGKLPHVREYLLKHGRSARFIDKRIKLPQIDISFTPPEDKKIVLSKAQLEVNDVLLNNNGGLIQMGCGGGKSIAMLNFISTVKQPTLIIVHTSTLAKQWHDNVSSMCSGNFTIGKLGGGKRKIGDVTIAIIDTLSAMCDPETSDYSVLSEFGCIIMDECHHVAASTFKAIVDNAPCLYKIGITGTANRKDKMQFLVFDSFGLILRNIEDNELKDRITPFTYEFIYTNSEYHVKKRKYFKKTTKNRSINIDFNDCLDYLINDKDRTALIINAICKNIEEGHKVLVLTYRTQHAVELYEQLSKKYRGYILIGINSKKFDPNQVNSDNDFKFIVANRAIAGEGMDIPTLSCLHITLPTSDKNMLKQYVARIRRYHKDKALLAHVVDYVDPQITCTSVDEIGEQETVQVLQIMAYARAKHYKSYLAEYNKDNPGESNEYRRSCKNK